MHGLASGLLEAFCMYLFIIALCRGAGKLIDYCDAKRNKKED